MKRQLGLLFIICAILFTVAALFFLFILFLARYRPDILPFNVSGYTVTFLVSSMCMALAYGLMVIGRKLRTE